jgi:hypothetical protein
MEKFLAGSVPITREHKPFFESAYQAMAPAASDLVFANLIGWQKYFAYHLLVYKNLLCVYFITEKRLEVLPPLLSAPCADGEYLAQFQGLAEVVKLHCAVHALEPVYRYFPNSIISRIAAMVKTVIPERDYFDYVYEREDLVVLPGEKFSPKRNLINQFKSRYKWEYVPLNLASLGLAKTYMDERRLDTTKHLTTKEYCIGCEMLNGFDMGFVGGMLLVDGKVAAVTVGSICERFEYEGGLEPSAIVHFESADISFKGAYQMINQQFCEHLPAEIKYVNREEDLGLQGLRKSKMSYNPARFVEKSIIALKGQ